MPCSPCSFVIPYAVTGFFSSSSSLSFSFFTPFRESFFRFFSLLFCSHYISTIFFLKINGNFEVFSFFSCRANSRIPASPSLYMYVFFVIRHAEMQNFLKNSSFISKKAVFFEKRAVLARFVHADWRKIPAERTKRVAIFFTSWYSYG